MTGDHDRNAVAEAAADFCAAYDDGEATLETVLALEAEADGEVAWAFDDVGVDSGRFGELVSRSFVESAGEGYRLVDREAVRAGMTGESVSVADSSTGGLGDGLDLDLGALAVLFVFRVLNWRSVSSSSRTMASRSGRRSGTIRSPSTFPYSTPRANTTGLTPSRHKCH